MLEEFVAWFICFGLSFLAESWGWAEQGKAFLYIHLGLASIILLIFIVLGLIAGVASGCASKVSGRYILAILLIFFKAAIELFATWGLTKVFNVDFYVAYQIMTFGRCLAAERKKKD